MQKTPQTMDVATSTVGQRPTTLYSFTPAAREAQEPPAPLRLLLAQFQLRYPTASLIAELLMIHDGNYVVRAMVQLGGTILVSGMAAAAEVELAEDRAKVRALETLTLQPAPNAYELQVRLDANLPERQLESVAQPPLLAQLPRFEQVDSMPDSKLVSLEELPEPSLDDLHQPEAEPFLEEIPEEIESESELLQRESVLATEMTIAASETPIATTPTSSTIPSWSALPAPEPETSHATTDLSDVIAQTTVELKRLGWTNAKGRTHLEQTYGKRSRQQLTDSELLDFLRYLESQPSPSQTPF